MAYHKRSQIFPLLWLENEYLQKYLFFGHQRREINEPFLLKYKTRLFNLGVKGLIDWLIIMIIKVHTHSLEKVIIHNKNIIVNIIYLKINRPTSNTQYQYNSQFIFTRQPFSLWKLIAF